MVIVSKLAASVRRVLRCRELRRRGRRLRYLKAKRGIEAYRRRRLAGLTVKADRHEVHKLWRALLENE